MHVVCVFLSLLVITYLAYNVPIFWSQEIRYNEVLLQTQLNCRVTLLLFQCVFCIHLLCRNLEYMLRTTKKKRNKKRILCYYRTSIPWALNWLENAYSRPLFRRATFTGKVGQTQLICWCGIRVHSCKIAILYAQRLRLVIACR